jgi:hypothetical protein
MRFVRALVKVIIINFVAVYLVVASKLVEGIKELCLEPAGPGILVLRRVCFILQLSDTMAT